MCRLLAIVRYHSAFIWNNLLIRVMTFFFFIFLVYLIRLSLVTFHELGHAIPALIYTHGEVVVYIGLKDRNFRPLTMRFGRLQVNLNYFSVAYGRGVCYFADTPSRGRHAVILVGGTVLTILASLVIWVSIMSFNPGFYGKLLAWILLGSALLSLLYDLIPNRTPVHAGTEDETYNDGYQLWQLYFPSYDVITLFNQGKYELALEKFSHFYDKDYISPEYYRVHALCFYYLKQYTGTLEFMENVKLEKVGLDQEDIELMAFLIDAVKGHEDALEYSTKMMAQYPASDYLKLHRASLLGCFNRHEEALELAGQVLKTGYQPAKAYEIRAYALLMTHQYPEALLSLNASLKLDPDSSYAHRNMRIYHYLHEDMPKAQWHFNKAYELDPETELLEGYMDRVYKKFNGYGRTD